MSIISQNLLPNSNSRLYSYFTNALLNSPRTPKFPLSLPHKPFSNPLHFGILKPPNPSNFASCSNTLHWPARWPARASEWDVTARKSTGADEITVDVFLSLVEFLCLASSAVISVGFVVNSAISSSQKPVFAWLGSRVFVWQFVLLVGAVAAGASIRRRQWRRICAGVAKTGDSGVDFVERIEKLEEDLRSSTTIIKVLSRHLEKLGIRFRVTRKALKEPIAEAAALAQKNSEATRALAVQEDMLEKELFEMQNVLLAMQEQQQKQLDLIIAIAKSGKVLDKKQGHVQKKEATETRNSAEKVLKQTATPQTQELAAQKEQKKEADETRNSAEKVVKQTGTPRIQALASQKEQKKEATETRISADKVVKQTGTLQIQDLASQKEANKETA